MCGEELDNVETMEMCSQAPVNHTVGEFHPENAEEQLAVEEHLPAVGRTRKPNSKDREDVEAEDNYQAKCSLGSYLSHVSTCINQVKMCLSELREPDEIREAVKSLELGLVTITCISVTYKGMCLLTNLRVLRTFTVRVMRITLDV